MMAIPVSIVTFLPFEPHLLLLFAVMALLLCVSALVSGSETALFALSPANVEAVKKRRSHSDQAIMTLLSKQDYMLATILIVNNLVNICIILLANRIFDSLLEFSSQAWLFAAKTVMVTFMLLLFGEIMPKIYSAYNPLGFARTVAIPLVSLMQIFRPFAWLLIRSGSFISDSLARKRGAISIDQLSNAMEITRNQTEEERQMLSGIVNFVNIDVEQIMKPRMDIVALDIGDDYAQVKSVINRSGFSRIPVYEESLDNIKGVLYVKDILRHIGEDAGFEWQKLLRKPYFVPEHKKINDLLEEFRSTKVHMAIVVDEYGSTVGLVSLEDIVEEIVGEISDESDRSPQAEYQKIDDNNYIFDGKTHLNEFLRVIDRDESLLDDVRGEAETVAGLMLEVKRDFLKQGESILVKGLRFTVKALEGRRIDKVRVKIN